VELRLAHAARAFSSHAFAVAYPYLSPGVEWEIVGRRSVQGKDAVVAVCEEATRELEATAIEFTQFDVVAEGWVIIQSRATYLDESGGRSRLVRSLRTDRRDDRSDHLVQHRAGISVNDEGVLTHSETASRTR